MDNANTDTQCYRPLILGANFQLTNRLNRIFQWEFRLLHWNVMYLALDEREPLSPFIFAQVGFFQWMKPITTVDLHNYNYDYVDPSISDCEYTYLGSEI